MPTVRDAVHQFLRDHYMTTVFGNPGSTELGFLDRWPADLRYVHALEEGSAVSMACGYAQMRGTAVLVNLHSAAGIGHAMGAVVTAHDNRSPVVLLAGQQARPLLPHDPFLANQDPTGLGGRCIKWACQPARAEDVPECLARAVQIATQPPYGPVLLSVPADDWTADAKPAGYRTPVLLCGPDLGAVQELAEALERSTRTAFVVGAAVDQDETVAPLVKLVDRLGAHVWAAPMSSRCSFPETHPYFAGHLPAAEGPLTTTLADYDLVVVLGAPAFTYHVHVPAQQTLPTMFVLSDDPQVLARIPAGAIGVHTTLMLGIDGLLTSTTPRVPLPEPPRRPSTPPPSGDVITPAHVLATLNALLPDNAVVVEEIPSHRPDLHQHLPITALHAGFLTTGGGVLGYAIPAAVGAAIAAPSRRVVAVVGDGSAMYRPQGLWTAAQQQIPLTIVVLDNRGYGALRSMAANAGVHGVPGLDIGGLDFAGLARAMGCDARSVSRIDELHDVLSGALDAAVPTVVHVVLD